MGAESEHDSLMAGMALPVLRGKLLEEARAAAAEAQRRGREAGRQLAAARRELADSAARGKFNNRQKP